VRLVTLDRQPLRVMNYRALAPSRAQEGHKTIESVKDQYQAIEFVKDQDQAIKGENVSVCCVGPSRDWC
jgi:hypothetical protein